MSCGSRADRLEITRRWTTSYSGTVGVVVAVVCCCGLMSASSRRRRKWLEEWMNDGSEMNAEEWGIAEGKEKLRMCVKEIFFESNVIFKHLCAHIIWCSQLQHFCLFCSLLFHAVCGVSDSCPADSRAAGIHTVTVTTIDLPSAGEWTWKTLRRSLTVMSLWWVWMNRWCGHVEARGRGELSP